MEVEEESSVTRRKQDAAKVDMRMKPHTWTINEMVFGRKRYKKNYLLILRYKMRDEF